MKRKSYNPFKMWGAWVGTIIFSIGFIINFAFNKNLAKFDEVLGTITPTMGVIYYVILVINLSVYSIIGFLLGWGIHSIIRSIRK